MGRFVLASFRTLAALVLLGGLAAQPAHAGQQAAAFVEGLAHEVIGVLENANLDVPAKREAFRTIFSRDFDVEGIAQLTLARYWRSASAPERAQFVGALRDYVAEFYASQFAAYHGEVGFVVLDEKPEEKGLVLVTGRLDRAGQQPVRVDFRLRERDGIKIVDVLIDGLSMVATKRSEFASILQSEGIDGLTARLKESASASASAGG